MNKLDDFLTERQSDEFSAEYQDFLDSLPEMLEEPEKPTIFKFLSDMKEIATETTYTRYFMDYLAIGGGYHFQVYPQTDPNAWRAKESQRVYNRVMELLDNIGTEEYNSRVAVTTSNGAEYVEVTRGRKFTTADGEEICIAIVPNETALLTAMFR